MAATVILQNGAMVQPRTVNIAGIGDVRATPVQFDGLYDGHAFTDLVAFCVDVYHRLTLGDYNPDLVYTDTVALTTDSNVVGAQTLSGEQLVHIGRLANYGTLVFYNAPTANSAQSNARYDQLASVQGAIWQVVSGRNVTSASSSIDALIDNLTAASYQTYFNASYGPVRSSVTFLTPVVYPAAAGSQGMVIVSAPEPTAWSLMILGFGGVGLMLRRRLANI